MSRAHMLYDDKKLQSLPVKVVTWNGSFNLDDVFCIKSNKGIIGNGQLLGKSRFLIVDGSKDNSKVHMMTFYVNVKKCYRRRFDAKGVEIMPDFGSKQKVNTGFLMSSYKEKSKEGEDSLTPKQLQDMIHVDELAKLTKEKLQSFTGQQVISLWFQEKDFDGMEFADGFEVRFSTKGDKSYLESIQCMDVETKHLATFTGDKPLGASWTDKVMAMKDSGGASASDAQQGDGAEDDEWDDD